MHKFTYIYFKMRKSELVNFVFHPRNKKENQRAKSTTDQ